MQNFWGQTECIMGNWKIVNQFTAVQDFTRNCLVPTSLCFFLGVARAAW